MKENIILEIVEEEKKCLETISKTKELLQKKLENSKLSLDTDLESKKEDLMKRHTKSVSELKTNLDVKFESEKVKTDALIEDYNSLNKKEISKVVETIVESLI